MKKSALSTFCLLTLFTIPAVAEATGDQAIRELVRSMAKVGSAGGGELFA